MNPVVKAYFLLRHLGPGFLWRRAQMALSRRLGAERRTYPSVEWNEIALAEIVAKNTPADAASYARFKREQRVRFLFPLGQPPAIPGWSAKPVEPRTPALPERLKLLREDRCVYFLRIPSPAPIDWYHNPFSDTRGDGQRPWYEIPDFNPAAGDARTLWEPARAAWALDLARAQARQVAAENPGLYWRWLDSWMDACPPWRGFHWKCGQESSVRFIALALGFWALAAGDLPAERWQQFARLAWATGYRVAEHIEYAISQKNNHALSEACGLILISQLFPEFEDSPEWRRTGRRVLAEELDRQMYADGSYVQHSFNYQRVMLHTTVLALRLAELAEEPFERRTYEHVGRAAEFLFQMMEPTSGRLPNYGSNDGACVLPLSECDLTDFRPALQPAYYAANRRRLLPAGAWDEELLWLYGAEALEERASKAKPGEPADMPSLVSSAFDAGGYYTLRSAESWAMIRCHTYRDRPGQCDALHLDLWWRGQNVLRDAGSYQYFVPHQPGWQRYFRSTAAHNTVEIDGRDPLALVSPFLWLPWPRAAERHFQAAEDDLYFEGESYAYDRRPWHVVHRRTVAVLDRGAWLIVDDLLGAGRHKATLRWHMLDAPANLDQGAGLCRLSTPAGELGVSVSGHPIAPALGLARGRQDDESGQGFVSDYYSQRRPIPVLSAEAQGDMPLRLVTIVAPGLFPSPRCMEHDATGESWDVWDGSAVTRIRLASPAWGCPRVLVRADA